MTSVPEVGSLNGHDVVLEGELILGAGRLSDFYRLAERAAGPAPEHPHRSFAALDILWLDGRRFADHPYDSNNQNRVTRLHWEAANDQLVALSAIDRTAN